MNTYLPRILVLMSAVSLIVFTTVVFIPAARTPPMRFAVYALTVYVVVEGFWRMRKLGLLKMTPRQIYASSDPRKPRAGLLETAAGIMGLAAMVTLSL